MAQEFSPSSGTGYVAPGTFEGTITITADEYFKLGYFRAGERQVRFNDCVFNADGSVTFPANAMPEDVLQ